ncbi:transferase hexapeptide repeat protein [Leptospira borgpetersenii]|uniref:Transferase hexapeptide repeat protein n=1 Tax=Leptospira borgpetersenii str. 200801926 TaxID=1193009 RepID=A0ABP2S7E3_LEPBO|nr:transferase hexapeptide repeat protein [Leptospira borgpetersenii]EKP14960.1 transferase hexapeptide repeat protein [Leptospira borgpetersenii str. 200801926]ENO64396.1 transferase hexapeptide repeat protein [Leptospira borgpetersenii serovar Mini str. 201000851]
MIISIGENTLTNLLISQISNNFLCDIIEEDILKQAMSPALMRSELCFKENVKKYYWTESGDLIFSPFHSDQYATFLYFLGQTLWKEYNNIVLADKVYCLNKMLNSFDLFYKVELPQVFACIHPVGSVIGRALFGNYFIFQQNCSVGENGGKSPVIGDFVWLCANSSVIGSSKIGNNVIISSGSIVKDQEVPDNSIVFGISPNLIFKNKPISYFYQQSPFKSHLKASISREL